MYSACTDSVKFLFSDKFTKSSIANEFDLLRSRGSDHQSMAQRSNGSRSHHSHDHHNSGSGSDRYMEDNDDGRGSHQPSRHSRILELNSPARSMARISGISSGDTTKKRFWVSLVPRDTVLRGLEDQETLNPSDPFENIADSRKHKDYIEAFNAFVGHPKKHDPAHLKLNEAG